MPLSDCATNVFEDALSLFEDLVPISASCFYHVADNERVFGHILRGMDYDSVPAYNSIYSSLDPCHPRRHVNSRARVVTLEKLIPTVNLERSLYYREFMAPLNMYYEAEVFFRYKGDIVAGVSLIRSRDCVPFSAEELRLIEGATTFIERLIAHRIFLPTRDVGDCESAEFTRRERDIITLVRSGFSNNRIGDALGIRVPTVKSHLQNIFGKLGVSSRTALIARLSREDYAYPHSPFVDIMG